MEKYLKSRFRIAETDYKLARTEAEKNEALREMHRIMVLAATKISFAFAESLRER